MHLTTFEEFYRELGMDNYVSPPFDYFKTNFMKADSKEVMPYRDWLIQHKPDDFRANTDEWLKILYDFFFEDPRKLLELWFKDHLYVDKFDLDSDMRYPIDNIQIGNVLDGKYKGGTGRINKNFFWKEIFLETQKTTVDSPTVLQILKDIYIGFKVTRTIFTPMCIDIYKGKRYADFFAVLRGTAAKASVFNPYTYFFILQTQLGRGKNLLCPVMSWGSPIIAFQNSPFENFVGIDVIPRVLEKSKEIHDWFENNKNLLEVEKTAKFYCCPSEDIDKEYSFSDKYKDYFDAVFFCPPYFDLEQYPDPNGNQSTTRYKTYQEWLNGYWRPTVELCHKTMKPGAKFSFVIVKNFRSVNHHETFEISEDMCNIAKEFFTYNKTLDLSWGGFTITKQNHDKRTEVIEHVHILEKT